MTKEYTVTRVQLRYLYYKMRKEALFLTATERRGSELFLEELETQFNEVDAMKELPENAYLHL